MTEARTTTTGTVLITGAGGAAGGAFARRQLGRGERVAAFGLQRETEALETLRREYPGRCCSFAAGLAPETFAEQVAQAEAELGPIDRAALIAGGWAGGTPLAETDSAVWQRLLDANLGTVRATLPHLLAVMTERGRGAIVLFGSVAAVRPWQAAGEAAYAASKAAVVSLAQTAAEEVRGRGVRVNAVLPTTLDTAANRQAMPDVDPRQWVSLDALGDVLDFLLSHGARAITGAALAVSAVPAAVASTG